MKIGLGIGVTKPQGMPVGLSQSPAGLFTAGEQGAWYDPSDINLTWRRNLLTYSEQFDNTAWTKSAQPPTVTANSDTAPDGTLTADTIASANGYTSYLFQDIVVAPGCIYTYFYYIKKTSGTANGLYSGISLQFFNGGIGLAEYGGTVDSDNGTIITASGWGTGGFSSSLVIDDGDYWKIICTLPVAPATATYVRVFQSAAGYRLDGTRSASGSSSKVIWGAQLELGSTATAYQRITDGVQDYLQYQAQPVLYQDAAGTTPVTAVEQPVGLMLDKSKGLVLGPELVTNGDFSNGTTGWTLGSGWSVSGGKLIATSVAFAVEAKQAIATLVAGSRYVVSFDVVVTSGTLKVNLSDLGISTTELLISASGTYTYRPFQSGTAQITFWASSTFTGSIDNISVRELPGNHAFQPTSANRPTLSARYNLLTKTEQFDDAVWTKSGGTNYANSTTAPDGTQTGALFIENTASGTHGYWQVTSSIPSGVSAKYTIGLKYHSRQYVRVAWVIGGGSESVYVDVDLIAGVVVNQGPYGVSTTQTSASITSAGLGWYTVEIKGTLPSATTYATVYARNSSTNSNPESALEYVGDGASGFYVWGADLRVANDALNQPAYQRVNTSTDYDTVGFRPYLAFNGTSSSMQTNSIDFSYGDKMFVCAGVRKLSDATPAILVELSTIASGNGAFYVAAPESGANYSFKSNGTVSQSFVVASGYSAPITNVLSGIGNISGDQAILRVNGTQAAISTADQGTGNYGNYPLYIGARAGSSVFFNGRLYGMVIRGAETNSTDIYKTEDYLNTKTRAYFPNTLFLESGENLLQEDGSYIILES